MEVQLDLTGLQGEIKLELVSTAETKRAVVTIRNGPPERWKSENRRRKNGQDSGINSVYNESQTIAKVVKDYREALPEATI